MAKKGEIVALIIEGDEPEWLRTTLVQDGTVFVPAGAFWESKQVSFVLLTSMLMEYKHAKRDNHFYVDANFILNEVFNENDKEDAERLRSVVKKVLFEVAMDDFSMS